MLVTYTVPVFDTVIVYVISSPTAENVTGDADFDTTKEDAYCAGPVTVTESSPLTGSPSGS